MNAGALDLTWANIWVWTILENGWGVEVNKELALIVSRSGANEGHRPSQILYERLKKKMN